MSDRSRSSFSSERSRPDRQIAVRHESLRVHLIDTVTDGFLTAAQVLAATDGSRGGLSVFMCGPKRMLSTFQRAVVDAQTPPEA